jgi:hypothetical protein
MTNKIKETISFTHKDIMVFVKIDYVNNKISLVEPINRVSSIFKAKNWIFADRGVEYMNGWLTILEAMGEAIKEAQARLEVYEDKKTKELAKLLIKTE